MSAMTVPTLYQFSEALQAPDLFFRTLGDCRPLRDEAGELRIVRTSRFAEAEIEWRGARHLLCFPLSAASVEATERTVARLGRLRTELLTPYVILRGELSWENGSPRSCDLLLHRLPDGGRPLDRCAADYPTEQLLAAIDRLEKGLAALHFRHNNLKPENIYLLPSGELVPVRYHFARFDEGDDSQGFASLRRYAAEQGGGTGSLLCDAAPAPYLTGTRFPGHLYAGEISDQLVRIEDREGYGFVDTENRPVIAPQFLWAADFREGRAEVQTQTGMGLIDKQGRYVIPPRYEIVEFNPYTGCSRLRSGGLWALADYDGRIGTPFTERYIEENEYIETK